MKMSAKKFEEALAWVESVEVPRPGTERDQVFALFLRLLEKGFTAVAAVGELVKAGFVQEREAGRALVVMKHRAWRHRRAAARKQFPGTLPGARALGVNQ